MRPENELREQIIALVREYADKALSPASWSAGEHTIPVSGRTFDHDEVAHLVDASLDFWLTQGRFAAMFEQQLASFIGRPHAILCNSGSSANLLALSALTSPKLGERRLVPGDEVITVAGGFPTTVNPIVQNRLVPVFVDVEPLESGTYNADTSMLEEALSDRTRAVILAHTLGNPFRIEEVQAFTKKNNLWLIEDNCDALGSTYLGRRTGSFGDLATFSFYPAHHITMGEGGCVVVRNGRMKKLVESFRDWGRDCWCEPGEADTCGKRFKWRLGSLPPGYDHKYIFSHIGYNLKATDMQAAIGVAQMKKLPAFIEARKRNFQYLSQSLADFAEHLILPQPTPNSDPSWFGFPISVRESAPFTKRDLVAHLAQNGVDTRMLFAGNLARQPAYRDVQTRAVGDLKQTDRVMHGTFWIGVYPGLDFASLDVVVGRIKRFIHGAH